MELTSIVVDSGDASLPALAKGLGLDYARSDWQRRDPTVSSDWTHALPPEQLWWDNYVVHSSSLAHARNLLPMLRSEGRAKRLVLVIAQLPAASEDPAWTPRRLQGTAQTAAMVVPGIGFAVVIEGAKWVNVHAAASAALRCYSDVPGGPVLAGLRVGITDAALCPWIAGDQLGSFMTDSLLRPEPDDIYSVDVIVGDAELIHLDGRTVPSIWSGTGTLLPPVDTAVISPQGFLPYPDQGPVRLEPQDVGGGRELTETDLQSLRRHSYVTIDGAGFTGSEALLARHVAQLAVAGVPLLADGMPDGARSLLGEKLSDLIQLFSAADSDIHRESKSIDVRRAALELFSPRARWNEVLRRLGRPLIPSPTVSAVMATRRPDKLASALEQLRLQSWDDLEVVLVLHGFDDQLPEVQRAINGYPRPLTVCSAPAGMVFGEVLNVGVRAAGGELVTKMDDDDWYGEHHIRDLVRAKSYSSATLVGSQVEFVYLQSLDITTRRPPAGERYTDHVAGGTMMMAKEDLRQLGGWRPVHRAVDRCLLQSVQAAAGLVYRTHGQNYVMQRHLAADSHGGHTWNPEDSIFLQNVAEQWDGFVLPPQFGERQVPPAAGRQSSLRSHFARSPKSASVSTQ
jgi:Glycosyl transferase family 2